MFVTRTWCRSFRGGIYHGMSTIVQIGDSGEKKTQKRNRLLTFLYRSRVSKKFLSIKWVKSPRKQLFKGFWKSRNIPGLYFWESRDRDFEKIPGSRDIPGSRRGLATIPTSLFSKENFECEKVLMFNVKCAICSAQCEIQGGKLWAISMQMKGLPPAEILRWLIVLGNIFFSTAE